MRIIKRFFIKFLLLVLKGTLLFKEGIVFALKFLKGPLAPVGRLILRTLFFFYKIYFSIRRHIAKIIPVKGLLGIATNKYFIHAAIVIVALGTVSQNLYARASTLGDYGKNSILFSLTQPNDSQDEMVQGLPINSDIESDSGIGVEAGRTAESEIININITEPISSFGFVGGDQSPTINTESTRTNIEYYIVQSGDALSTISESFGIGLSTLLWANNLSSRSTIRPGDKLTILPIDGVSYTIKKGDTLAAIAKKYSADVEKIKEFNRLDDSAALAIGQVLILPGGKVAPVPVAAPSYSSGYTAASYASSGQLLWPVPTSHRITQYFSWKHPAIDVGLPTGSPVVAAEAGTIIYSGWGTGYGYEILIDHGGFKTRYAHNSKLFVKVGDRVERGQQIASSGNTGNSTGPHLHFEVYAGATRQNPLSYVK